MKKLKYIAPILIAVACFGLHQAKADTISYSLSQPNTPSLGNGPFGTVTVTLTGGVATIRFDAASGYLFGDGQAVDVNVNGSFILGAITSSNGTFTQETTGHNVDGFGDFNLRITEGNFSNGATWVQFTLTGGSWASASQVLTPNELNWLVAAHVFSVDGQLTGYVAGNSVVPDGGTTVMLLGAALGVLAMVRRRFLRS
jgi:hypothetical protein